MFNQNYWFSNQHINIIRNGNDNDELLIMLPTQLLGDDNVSNFTKEKNKKKKSSKVAHLKRNKTSHPNKHDYKYINQDKVNKYLLGHLD